MVALQRDMTFFCAAEIGIRSELARFHFRFPLGTPQFVFEQFRAVEPVLDMGTFRDNPRAVPFADRFKMSVRRWL